jgi:hypothetical protein
MGRTLDESLKRYWIWNRTLLETSDFLMLWQGTFIAAFVDTLIVCQADSR